MGRVEQRSAVFRDEAAILVDRVDGEGAQIAHH